ncbi:DUF3592 domain-containing protein [Spartinivicinus poritis]|uniref:DUF3592 domain-containing protein n=1 Tax=Spartinivicinus poritis TaxID=2994640 RepID=A0ABT5U7Z9_9GAMM|nr:DUF3592 domain-containing protein [Spartinivicinus sp. A2-2]MDE1462499.1 DUF3592 domain-containing protein [Spartinivicinus sp. A2-2]
MEKIISKLVIICMLFIFSCIGIWLVYDKIHDFYMGQQALNWKETPGLIVKCTLTEIKHKDDEGEKLTWKVELQYKYVVDGFTYKRERLAFGYSDTSFYDVHKQIYKKLQTSDKILVKYDPNYPENSVVVAGFNMSQLEGILISLLFILFLIIAVVIEIISKRDSLLVEKIKMV